MREKNPIHERQNKGNSEFLINIFRPGRDKKDKDELYLISYKYGMKVRERAERGVWYAMSNPQDGSNETSFLSYPLCDLR